MFCARLPRCATAAAWLLHSLSTACCRHEVRRHCAALYRAYVAVVVALRGGSCQYLSDNAGKFRYVSLSNPYPPQERVKLAPPVGISEQQ
jgi:hypothetical protein